MVFKSQFQDVCVEESFNNSLSEFFWRQLDLFAEKVLFVDHASGDYYTGRQTKTIAIKIAEYLIEEAGLKRGDCCVFFHQHTALLQVAAIGVLFAGGNVCAGFRDDPAHEHSYMIEQMEPAVIFTDSTLLDEMLAYKEHNKHHVSAGFKILLLDDTSESAVINRTNGSTMNVASYKQNGYQNGHQNGRQNGHQNGHQQHSSPSIVGLNKHIISRQPTKTNSLLPVKVDPEDAAFVLLTSGSTGHPKPVNRSHRNSIHVCHSLSGPGPESLWRLNEQTVMAGHLPLDHGTGTFALKMTLAKGLKLIIMDRYEPELLLEAIDKHRITDCMLGSALLHNLISLPQKALERYNLSSLRNLIATGSPIPSHAQCEQFMDRHRQVNIRQAFGMTECGFISIVPEHMSHYGSAAGVGQVLPNLRLKILELEEERGGMRKEVNELEREGELFVSGATVSPGYIGRRHKEQSARAFQADGFYKSSDICRIGQLKRTQVLFIKGRCTDVLCLNDGWKVLPFEIESVLLRHPDILEAAVVGVPHPELATCHAPRAYVVPKPGARVSERQVFDFAASHLSEPKHLVGGVRLMNELPRISVGKVDKATLKKMDGFS